MLAENVVKLNQNEVYEQILKYLNKKEYKSESKETVIAYTRDIKRFFEVIKQKEIQFLTREDVQITLDDFEDFIEYMRSLNKYSNKTINRNVTAVKGLLRYLYSKKIVDDIGYILAGEIDSLSETKNSYGVFSIEEVFKLADLAKEERNKGHIKYWLILFSMDSCIRKRAALNLKVTDFDVRDDYVIVKAVDKGNKDFRPKIAKWVYDELMKLPRKNQYVFDISQESLKNMWKRLMEKMNLPKERRLVWHSLRKTGATFQYRLTGDLLQAKKALNHSSITTTQSYLAEEDYGVIGAVSSSGNIDMELYKKVDRDVLIEAIESLKKDAQLILNMKIQDVLNKKNEL